MVSASRLQSIPVLALGFRAFFLAAGVAAILSVAVWLAILSGLWPQPSHLAGTAWHAHEMLFGYLAAVIAGFLLTAVRNWTGMATASGAPLAALVGLWLAGRLAPWLGLPPWLVALIDLAFFPALALALWRPLWSGPNPVNRVFLAVFAGMTLAGAMVHLDALGLIAGGATRGHRLMLDLVVLVMLLVSGRVMPFFIKSGIANARPRVFPLLERLVFIVAAGLLVIDLVQPMGRIAGGLALTLGLLQLTRLIGWHDRRIWTTPMLTVLYVGLLWLALGLILDGLPAFAAMTPRSALHTLTIGAIGVVTLGMMSRVTVGHTGRPMQAAALTLVAFVLINLAAALRGLGPLLVPAGYQVWLMAGGLCWILAFGLFLWVHAPMLLSPRPDGRPG
ncbi:NnrS family protein [Thiorhodococcus mannitoliphagus]|uniref:NnrS family protein n=1 Tax=Thiorhodococcus mannitoliphagus TaxID=329406 RepID=A0A6P1DUR0_9GAMM|nr:NnrS family protein [Thiorhodococcus mannitoliphagus]NEX20711.1 NnrS family protein [Thiorhodococcus mannitoliphagus]